MEAKLNLPMTLEFVKTGIGIKTVFNPARAEYIFYTSQKVVVNGSEFCAAE